MSRKHTHRRQPRRGRITTTVATTMAATEDRTDEALEAAKRLSHDRLVDNLGPRRRSGVAWFIYESDSPEAAELLDILEHKAIHSEAHLSVPQAPPGVAIDLRAGSRAEQYAQTRDFLDEHPGGYLVVAEAQAVIR